MKNPERYKMSKLDEHRLWVAIHDQENNVAPTQKYEALPTQPSTETQNTFIERLI